jgi:hypothetical protein
LSGGVGAKANFALVEESDSTFFQAVEDRAVTIVNQRLVSFLDGSFDVILIVSCNGWII